MSICEYCGEKAGWFQTNHPACVTKASSGRKVVEKLVFDGTSAGRSYDELSAEVQQVLTDSRVSFKYVRDEVLQGGNDAASQLEIFLLDPAPGSMGSGDLGRGPIRKHRRMAGKALASGS
jgi:hypothetical protein